MLVEVSSRFPEKSSESIEGETAMRFAKAHKRLGFGRLPALDGSRFVAPRKPSPQGDLF